MKKFVCVDDVIALACEECPDEYKSNDCQTQKCVLVDKIKELNGITCALCPYYRNAIKEDKFINEIFCPSCGKKIHNALWTEYCPRCGIHIDWNLKVKE